MLYLASRSPRRLALLKRLHVTFQALDVTVCEDIRADASAQDYVLRLAREKAAAGLNQLGDRQDVINCVLGADTVAVIDGQVLGKPVDESQAHAMLSALSGRTHCVLTAVALVRPGQPCQQVLVSSYVRFMVLSSDVIARYVGSGEPMGKAGAYAIQGDAERFVTHLSGSYSAVMGLPLCQTAQLLSQVMEV